MTFKVDPNQRLTPRGTLRYNFDIRLNGKRFRKTVVCKQTMVRDLYHKWILECGGDAEKDRLGNWSFLEKYDEYCDFYLRYHCEGDSGNESYRARIRTRAVFIRVFPSGMLLRDVKRRHIEDFVVWRRAHPTAGHLKQSSNATINREISVLSHFFSYCIQRDFYTGNNPAGKMKLAEKNVRRIRFDENQFRELFTKAKQQGKIFTAVLLAVLAGLRREEVFSLAWRDVDLDNRELLIRSRNAKGGKGRIVPMSDTLVEHMTELRRAEPQSILIFEGWATVDKLKYEWKKLRRSLTFSRFEDVDSGRELHLTFHDFRHACATFLHERGMSLDEIKEMLGHSSIRVTERYYANTGRAVTRDRLNKIHSSLDVKPE